MGIRVVLAAILAGALAPLGAGATRPVARGLVLGVTPDGHVATVNVATGREHVLAAGGDPSWSPDGRRIVYLEQASPAARSEVFVVDADGRHVKQLTHDDVWQRAPVWSPDGKHIAFVEQPQDLTPRTRYDVDLVVVDAQGGGRLRLRRLFMPGGPLAWSPDGTSIVCSERGAVVTIDLAGNRHEIAASAGGAAWSRDGRRIAYLHQPTGGTHELVVADAGGSNPRTYLRYTDAPAIAGLAWSPDGRAIAFDFGGGPAPWYRIELLDVRTGQIRGLTRVVDGHFDFGPTWSPDGKWIAFSRRHIGQDPQRITLVARTGGAVRRLRAALTPLQWRPRPH